MKVKKIYSKRKDKINLRKEYNVLIVTKELNYFQFHNYLLKKIKKKDYNGIE